VAKCGCMSACLQFTYGMTLLPLCLQDSTESWFSSLFAGCPDNAFQVSFPVLSAAAALVSIPKGRWADVLLTYSMVASHVAKLVLLAVLSCDTEQLSSG